MTFLRTLVVLLATSAPLLGQSGAQKQPVQAWVFNFENAPLTISSTGSRIYALKNVGAQEIVEYQLGCVITSHYGARSIVYKFPQHKRIVKLEESVEVIGEYAVPERRVCIDRSALVGVVYVRFRGGDWSAGEIRGSSR